MTLTDELIFDFDMWPVHVEARSPLPVPAQRAIRGHPPSSCNHLRYETQGIPNLWGVGGHIGRSELPWEQLIHVEYRLSLVNVVEGAKANIKRMLK